MGAMSPNGSVNIEGMKSNQGVTPNVSMNTGTVPQEGKEDSHYFQLVWGGEDKSSQASKYLS